MHTLYGPFWWCLYWGNLNATAGYRGWGIDFILLLCIIDVMSEAKLLWCDMLLWMNHLFLLAVSLALALGAFFFVLEIMTRWLTPALSHSNINNINRKYIYYTIPKCPNSASSSSPSWSRLAPPLLLRRPSRRWPRNKPSRRLLSHWTPLKITIRKPTGKTNTHPPRSWDPSCPRCPPACSEPCRLSSSPRWWSPSRDPPPSSRNPVPWTPDRG